MSESSILNVLEKISKTTLKNEKISLLNENKDVYNLEKILNYTYNPHLRYNIIPDNTWNNTTGIECLSDKSFQLLDKLIKRELTGHSARDAILEHISTLDTYNANLLINIIRKDLRCGIATGTINKVYKNLIPEYCYMRCSLPNSKNVNVYKFDWKYGVYSQLKSDGVYANCNIEDNNIVFLTRQGSELPIEKLSNIVEYVKNKNVDDSQIHGELTVYKNGVLLNRSIGNGIINSIIQGGELSDEYKIVYVVWDIIPLKHAVKKGHYKVPYHKRLALLESYFNDVNGDVVVTDYEIFHSYEDAIKHSYSLIEQGFEGTVIKNPHMEWKDGTSKEQIKIKIEFDCDLEIVEILQGKVGTKNEGKSGSILCKSSDDLLEVAVTVKNDDMRDRIDSNPDEWIGKIVVVIANDVLEPSTDSKNKKRSLFLPRFKVDTYRIDKDQADTLEKIIESKNSFIQ